MEAIAGREGVRAFEATGTVLAVTEGVIEVWTGDRTAAAKRAVSCLVVPEEGDRVLLVELDSAESYVLAVLERPGRLHTRLAMDGDVTIELRSGRFGVSAPAGIELVSTEAITFAADRIEARAREGSLLLGSARLIAGAVDAVLERLSQSVRHAFRRVEGVDHLRAGQIDYAADGLTRVHGQHTLLTASELVKADGKQIHFG